MKPSDVANLTRLLAVATLALASSAAYADASDWYIAPSLVYTDDDGDRRLDDSVGGGEIRIGWKWNDKYALEGNFGYHNIDGWPSWPAVTERQSQEFLDIGLNLLRTSNPDARFSSYVMFGAGYLGTETDLGATNSSPTATAGVGFKLRFGASRWALRGEYRWRHAFDDNSLTDQMTSLGLQYSFGDTSRSPILAAAVSQPQPEAIAVHDNDSDDDGVLDGPDRCPGTAPGVEVDLDGCEIQTGLESQSIYFGFDSDAVLHTPGQMLDEAAAALKRDPNLRIEIAGHTDARGSEDYNMELSLRRANAVRQYLEQAGVDPDNMTVRGHGESHPAASNETANGLSQNRRVEIQVVGQ